MEIHAAGVGDVRVESRFTGEGFDAHFISIHDVDAVRIRQNRLRLMYGEAPVSIANYTDILGVIVTCPWAEPPQGEDGWLWLDISEEGVVRDDLSDYAGCELLARGWGDGGWRHMVDAD